jgi:excisionase family DNA binding protein
MKAKRTLQTTETVGADRAPNVSTTSNAVLTVEQVANRLQISKNAVYELTRFRQSADTPRLPARKVGRSLRFIAAEVDAWIVSLPKHRHLQRRQYVKKVAA